MSGSEEERCERASEMCRIRFTIRLVRRCGLDWHQAWRAMHPRWTYLNGVVYF
jgi:hypothetical protein